MRYYWPAGSSLEILGFLRILLLLVVRGRPFCFSGFLEKATRHYTDPTGSGDCGSMCLKAGEKHLPIYVLKLLVAASSLTDLMAK